jgi:hypothetical protein
MSLLFSCCSSAEECRNEKGRRHFRAAADGLKIDYFENVRSAGPGPSKAEPSFYQCGVKNVVPAEEHKECCETETRLFAVKVAQ